MLQIVVSKTLLHVVLALPRYVVPESAAQLSMAKRHFGFVESSSLTLTPFCIAEDSQAETMSSLSALSDSEAFGFEYFDLGKHNSSSFFTLISPLEKELMLAVIRSSFLDAHAMFVQNKIKG